eukprot:m.378458 g.378458  ORF g.378458 m.378458 type:complete len:294 (-) comp28218_c0_seq1:918-1799(-)
MDLGGEAAVDDGKRRRTTQVVTPGDVITADAGYMRGHGTFQLDGQLIASVAGVVQQVNKLICVRPLRSRYVPEIGDVVVGRITEVGQRRWKVDVHTRLDAVLLLSSVNLPGGQLRRKSAADELLMRQMFVEGEVISAEVQSIFQDGAPSMHTRSMKYGKLTMGSFVAVVPALVKRCKNHFHKLPCGVSVVLGNNGYIWIGVEKEVNDPKKDGAVDTDHTYGSAPLTVERGLREKIARVRNVILALASQGLAIFDTTIIYAYEDSEHRDVKDLSDPEVEAEVTARARAACLTTQ